MVWLFRWGRRETRRETYDTTPLEWGGGFSGFVFFSFVRGGVFVCYEKGEEGKRER